MSQRSGIVHFCLFSPGLLLAFALSAAAQTPAQPTSPGPCQPRRQVMPRQIGFEAQQQGYAAKVQGAASQNIVWIEPREIPQDRQRRTWFDVWRGFFELFE
jgi:hypothetical protein